MRIAVVTMTNPGGAAVALARAAAQCTTIDALAQALLAYLDDVDDLDVETAAVWSRFGQGRWHTILTQGHAPAEPPVLDHWQLLRVRSGHRTTTVGFTPAALPQEQEDLLRALLEAGLRRLESEASLDAATQAGDHRLATILDATPDAVIVVALDGEILHANRRATEMFGHALDELIGSSVERLVPSLVRGQHREHRDTYAAAPTSRSMAAGQDLHAVHRDRTEVPVDIALEPMEIEGRTAVAAFVRDATARRRAEEHRHELARAAMARQQALELNDNVVQGLTSSIWLLEMGDKVAGLRASRETLSAAWTMMLDLLGGTTAPIEPGTLQRGGAPPSTGLDHALPGAADTSETPGTLRPPDTAVVAAASDGALRAVIADDSQDLRLLLQLRLQGTGIDPVAAVGDGRSAVEAVDEHRPDVVIMDLSMPVLDGLEATALIRQRHPELRIVVLSGHPREAMLEQALAAGADAYVQKGSDFTELIEALQATR